MRFSTEEIKELGISALVIGFVFAWAMQDSFPGMNIFVLFVIMLAAVGTAFIFHELSHKYTAQKYGCWAEYRMWETGLIIAFFLAVVIRAVFIAPGAVYIQCGYYGISKRENGIIAVSGAAANIVLAAAFWMISSAGGALELLGRVGFLVNTWIALFNMIPLPPFDGSKVIRWSVGVWAAMVGLAFILLLKVG